MANFKVKNAESKIVGKATFNKKEDFKVVTLKESGKDVLLHVIHADKLIAKGAAKLSKDVNIESTPPNIVVTPANK